MLSKIEGEVSYRFMVESGDIARGTTQIGKVRRPLAAVSKITKAGNIAFFSEDCDWLIDKRDPVAGQILELIEKVKRKTKVYQHKGTYRIRAWIVPEEEAKKSGDKPANPFGRQGR